MVGEKGGGADVRALLARVEAAPPTSVLEVAAEELAAICQATDVGFLLVDYSGRAVIRLDQQSPGPTGGRRHTPRPAESLPLAGTVYQQVLRTQQVDVRALADGARMIMPVTVRGDAIGVMEVDLPFPPDEQQVAQIAGIGHALGNLVVVNRRYTDLFDWGQRTAPQSLSAEIQRRLLPSALTCEAGQFTIAGWLEPAATVGGDTLDYALDPHTLHLSITDAVGHDVTAALLATVLVGSFRNARRRGLDLGDQARAANDELAAYSSVGQFVTGQLVRIDLRRESAAIVNAGHPFPIRLRGGRAEEIELGIDMPFGLEPGRSFQVQELDLAPGDRLVFVTDGLLEGRAATLDVFAALRDTADLHPREVVHALADELLRVTGNSLRDDGTVLCLDWHGGSARRHDTDLGASRGRASSPDTPRS